jgi:hypothetical protein
MSDLRTKKTSIWKSLVTRLIFFVALFPIFFVRIVFGTFDVTLALGAVCQDSSQCGISSFLEYFAHHPYPTIAGSLLTVVMSGAAAILVPMQIRIAREKIDSVQKNEPPRGK